MKNIFKLMGVALMACSMTMVSCNKDENNDGNDGNTIADGIKVTFDGNTWDGTVNQSKYYASYDVVEFTTNTGANYPAFDEAIYTSQVGAVTESNEGSFTQDNTHGWVEYYEQATLQDNNGNYYGDWWAAEATTDIKAIDLTTLKVTAQMNGTMFSAYEAYVDGAGFADATRAPYSATFGNIALTAK